MKLNLKPAGVGAEPKKLILLGLLFAVAAYFFFFNGPKTEETAATAPKASQPAATPNAANRPATTRPAVRGVRGGSNRNLTEFRPSLKPKDVDRSSVDPTLHIGLLAKLQDVKPDEATRSIFEFGKEPVPQLAVKEPEPIKPKFMAYLLPAPPPKPVEVKPAPEPQAPPIPLKFYGFINPQQTIGPKRAFFLDGEEIIVATEGDMVKKRYKIVRIGVNSAVVEDTQFKSNNQQTLPLVEEQAG